jgi:excisionase family DNA binding protein
MKQENTYTVAQAAELLNVRPVTVYRWIENGTCQSLRVGPKLLRIQESEITRLLSSPVQAPLTEQTTEA